MSTLLRASGLNAFHGDLQALFDVNFEVAQGTTVALIGANGAGKSTLLESLCGLVRSQGQVSFKGESLQGKTPAHINRMGLALVPEGRRLFASLSIEENLRIGADRAPKVNAKDVGAAWNLQKIYDLFPDLAAKRHMPPGALSGGQQQMASIGRALMSNPSLLLCDELSLGLSPAMVRVIYDSLPRIAQQGTAIVLVEQDTTLALASSHYVYCLCEGCVVLEGAPVHLSREAISQAYFGSHGEKPAATAALH